MGKTAYVDELMARLRESLIVIGFEGMQVSAIKVQGDDLDAQVEILFALDDIPGIVFGFHFPAYDDPVAPDLDAGAWATVVWANFLEQIRSDAAPDFADLIERQRGSSIVWVPSGL